MPLCLESAQITPTPPVAAAVAWDTADAAMAPSGDGSTWQMCQTVMDRAAAPGAPAARPLFASGYADIHGTMRGSGTARVAARPPARQRQAEWVVEWSSVGDVWKDLVR